MFRRMCGKLLPLILNKMKTLLTYLKNSNTGDIIIKQEFTETSITGIPIYYYTSDSKTEIINPDLTGYVKISEKHFKRLIKKI